MLPDNNIIDIIISLVLVYALLSILVSILAEWVNQQEKSRAKFLKDAIFKLLKDPLNVHFGELFYTHFLVNGMYNKKHKRPPQYISSSIFAEVLIDLITQRTRLDIPIRVSGQDEIRGKQYMLEPRPVYQDLKERFEAGLRFYQPSPLVDTLQSFLDKSKTIDDLKKNIAFWYDDYMDRVSGWFKYTQRWRLLTLGLIVAVALNVDSLHLVKVISLDDTLRGKLVATAEKVAENYQQIADSSALTSADLLKTFQLNTPDSVRRRAGRLMNLNDSISQVAIQRADSVLGIAASLNIPLGWDKNSAPLSWFNDSEQKVRSSSGVLSYISERNAWNGGNLVRYLVGILITAVSLSFGARFWFDALVKLINIRRAGKKPEATNSPN